MKRAFRTLSVRNQKRRDLMESVLSIISTHQQHGIKRVTARQLYYRLVAANLVPNTERSYKSVTALLADMRYWGKIDWDFIVDLGREPIVPNEYRNVEDLVEAAVYSLRYDRWAGQPSYVEVWVEKQALQSVLQPIGASLHVPIVVNKGYTSASAMYRASLRLKHAKGRNPVVLYFGDLDPSGEDMLRDVRDRLGEFGSEPELRKIGLTLEQVQQYACPPNPAKSTDSRFQGYASKMQGSTAYEDVCSAQGLDSGDVFSWELDSLPVEALSALVEGTVRSYITKPELVERVKRREERDKEALRIAAEEINTNDDDPEEGQD